MLLTIRRLLKIYISVAKGSTCYHITTNANRENRTSGWKFLKQHGFSNIRVQVSDIQRCHGVIGWTRIHFENFTVTVLSRTLTLLISKSKKLLHFLFTMTIAFLRPRCTLTYTNLKSSDSRLYFVILRFFLDFVYFMIFFLFYKNISRNSEDCVTYISGNTQPHVNNLAHQRKRWRLWNGKTKKQYGVCSKDKNWEVPWTVV